MLCFQYGGVNVDVQMTEGAVYATFSLYSPGMAPALILNHTDDALSFWEKGSNNIMYVDISFLIQFQLSVF
jgi:vacuolar protein sorting-associated protein 13A/C